MSALFLGMHYIQEIEKVMVDLGYVVGGIYNCLNFNQALTASLNFTVKVKFSKLTHRPGLFGLKDIAILFKDDDWKPWNHIIPKDIKINADSLFLLEDFHRSVLERRNL